MLRALLRDSVIYAIPSLVSRGMALLLLPLYTRWLSPADYGSMDLLLVFASLVNLTVSLEVSQGVARFHAGEKDPVARVIYASSALWFTIACYALSAILMFVWAEPLANQIMGRSGMTDALRIGIVYIMFNGPFLLLHNQLRWELRSAQYAIVSLTMSLITAAVAVWLVYGLRWGLHGMLTGMAVGSAAGCVMGAWWLRFSYRLTIEWARLKPMLAFSTPLVVSGVAVWVGTYVDRLMIQHLLTLNDVGLYGVGFRIAGIAALTMIGFQSALTPLIYAHYQDPGTPPKLAQIFRAFVYCACVIVLLLVLFAPDIVQLLAAPAFSSGAGLVVFLAPAILLASMYVFAPGISIAKKTHVLIWINVAGAALNCVLNFLLIPLLGIAGAGWATLISSAAVFGAYMFFSQRWYPVPHRWRVIALSVAIAATLAAGLPHLALSTGTRWAVNGLVVLAFSAIAIALGLVRFDELRQLAAMVTPWVHPGTPRTTLHDGNA